MTRLLDLPNELILKIVENVSSQGRRRLSKTNRLLYYVIRNQKNWDKYHVQERITFLDVKTYAKSIHLLGLRYGTKQTPSKHFFCLPETSTEQFWNDPKHDYMPRFTVETVGVVDPKETIILALKEAVQYFAPYCQSYHSSLELFDLRIAETIGEVEGRVTFVIESDILNKHMEDIYFQLFLLYLKHMKNSSRKKLDGTVWEPFFWLTHRYLRNGRCISEDVNRRRQIETTEWRKRMMERLRTFCHDHNIQCRFTKDPRKLGALERSFRLQYCVDGTMKGVFEVEPLLAMAFQRRWNAEKQAWSYDYDSESDPDL